jgi:CheY-like chemotaxis protein
MSAGDPRPRPACSARFATSSSHAAARSQVCPIHRSQEGGQAALERLEQTVYDPALCDLEMPEVDGVAICRAGGQLASPSSR